MVGEGNVVAAWRAPETPLVGYMSRTPPLPFCGLSFVVPPVLTIPLRATRGLPFLVLPQLWQGLEWLDHPPGQGSLSVRAGTLAWQRRTLVVMDSGTIFTVLSACEIWCPDRLRARSGSARPCL